MSSDRENVASSPGYYLWEVPDKPVSIQISLDVVDRLQQDILRGFGAVPRRGAEVGGVLLGSSGAGPVARIDDYELIPIEYKRGPSYLLSDEDTQAFDATLDRLRAESSGSLRPIGFFRSHTRDGEGLGEEDLALLAKHFPGPDAIVLWIRPFATKPSMAGFYFQEDGAFPTGPPLLEFPFRRGSLSADDASARPERSAERPIRRIQIPPRPGASHAEPERQPRPHSERPPIQRPERRPLPGAATGIQRSSGVEAGVAPADVFQLDDQVRPNRRRSFLWAPLSLIFLLLGLLLGFQAALTMRPRGANTPDPYRASLSVTKSGNDLQVKWDRQSPAVQSAQRGLLTIEDGAFSKPIELDSGQLQNGGVVVYRHFSNQVRFRLELFLKDRIVLKETIDWKQPDQVP